MTFDEIEDTLPNGFHDGLLLSVSIDYIQRKAVFGLEIWVGGMEHTGREEREAYREAKLTLTGLFMCAVDVPDTSYLDEEPAELWIDVARDWPFEKSPWPKEELPDSAFRRSFYFMNDADTFIHFAALQASLEWTSEPRTIY